MPFDGLTLLAFTFLGLHLLSAQLASAGPIVAMLFESHGTRRRQEDLLMDGRGMARTSLLALLGTVLFGGLLGTVRILAGADYLLAWRQFPWRITWGVAELAVSAVLMIGYLVWYPQRIERRAWGRFLHRLLALVATTNLLYHMPPLLAAIADTARGTRSLVDEEAVAVQQSILSTAAQVKSLHFALGALFTSSIWGVLTARAHPSVKLSARMAVGTIVLQWPLGFWLVTTLTATEQRRLMGGSPLHTALLVGGLLASVVVLFQLLELVTDPTNRQQRLRVGITSLCLVMAMVGLLV